MADQRFSALSRKERLRNMTETHLDVLVIGGGITGAGITLDSTARGLNTACIEMQDFAAGTSSRSTKLVHGGLRYLEQFEIKLVAEVGRERAIVYENAPHVTEPEWMLLPIVKGGNLGKTTTSFGLQVYDRLAQVNKHERRYMLNKKNTLKKEPLLREENLLGGGVYVEYRTDDARLTLEAMKKAVELGADAVNYAKATDLLYDNGKLIGVEVKDLINNETHRIYADHVVNAAGPWVDTLRKVDGSNKGKLLHHTKGIHLVFDLSRFPLRQATYFDAPDGRMIFAIPRGNKAYVGTTDTDYGANLQEPRVSREDRDYILEVTNYEFPSLKLKAEDVESSWSGIRPLIQEEGKSASEISRKDEIFISDSGLISIAGGKLTGYRKMAERIVDVVVDKMNIHAPCPTQDIQLSGGEVGGSSGYETFAVKEAYRGEALGMTRDETEDLFRFYGANGLKMLELLEENLEEAKNSGMPLKLAARLLYALEYEMAVTPLDFLNRRTAFLFFDMPELKRWKEAVTAFMKKSLNWSEEETKAYTEELESEIAYATKPYEDVEDQKAREKQAN